MKNIDHKLDVIFSIYIRLRYTNENGKGNCYTCQTALTFKTGQCGHYIKRGNIFSRWLETNAKLQCEDCNCFKHGLAEPFRDRLVSELGFEDVSQMERNAMKPYKMFDSDKKSLFEYYKAECTKLLKDKMFSVNLP